MARNKYLEYYMDSRIFSGEDVQRSIDETKKEFPNRKIKVSISINEFEMYVITFRFENKNSYFNKIKIKFWNKHKKPLLLDSGNKRRLEKYCGENRYGQYKKTGTYKPY